MGFSLFLYVSLCVWYLILLGVLLSIPPLQAFQNVLLGLSTLPADIIWEWPYDLNNGLLVDSNTT
jgi:hypothetical protein